MLAVIRIFVDRFLVRAYAFLHGMERIVLLLITLFQFFWKETSEPCFSH
jgi:hypothetical protein